jgi:predicted transposase YbfD/YdcC
MVAASKLSILTHFAELKDPRINRTKRHLLLDIIGLSICAVISGADNWLDIQRYGNAKMDWLKTFLALPNGIPSHDTIERVFRRLKPQDFQRCFANWMQSLHEELGLKQVAIDGKTLRRSFDRAGEKSALHLVSAWSTENHLTLGQVAVDGKSNEITAIPQLLRMLDLSGAVVTIDAMGCQKEIAAQIVEAEADYVLAVKDNQPNLHEDLQEHFLQLHETDFANAQHSHYQTKEESHGRVTRRYYYTTPLPATLRNSSAWRGLRSVGQVVTVTTRGGKETDDVRYFINSIRSNARRFASAVRGHWGIENSLHWVLDVSFDEDHSRIRKDHGAENFALLRRIAVSLIKREASQGSIRGKRKIAGWNTDLLLNILAGAT